MPPNSRSALTTRLIERLSCEQTHKGYSAACEGREAIHQLLLHFLAMTQQGEERHKGAQIVLVAEPTPGVDRDA